MCSHENWEYNSIGASKTVVSHYFCGSVYATTRTCLKCSQKQVLDNRWKTIEKTDWFSLTIW